MIKEVSIVRMGLEGQGVGYDSEKNIYFVPRALIGDRVRVKITETTKRYRDAELLEVIEAGPHRITPTCSYFHVCGGCDWLDWDYSAQLKAKEDILRHVLERGSLSPQHWAPICGASETFGYRNRIQMRRQGGQLGFFKRGTHELVDIESCQVARPEINQELQVIRSELNKSPSKEISKVELYVDESGKLHRFDDVPHSFGGFSQVHASQNQKLRQKVSQIVTEKKAKVVLELFCGNGNLTFYYADAVQKIWGVDASKPAIDAARSQRETLGSDHVLFFADKVDRTLLRRLPPEAKDYDTLILDPPRQGTLNSLPGFLNNQLKTIIYISCSPLTFSQDVQCLKKQFTLQKVEPIDMFPQTRHVEFISTWVRN